MIEKRRYGAGFPTSPFVAVLLTAALCLSLWRLSACPGPPVPRVVAPTYLLLLPGNATSLPPPYPMHKLPPEDRSTLIDIRDFNFLLNNYPCNDTEPLLLLVLVHSAPANIEKRQTIRETWGRAAEDVRVRVLFLLGAVDLPFTQQVVEDENRVFRDIIQGSFVDTYRNMTYKHVMALKWTAYYCPGARYLLKTDDDVFVNSPTLVDFLSQELSNWGARRLILCSPFGDAVVKRSFRSKWRVSPLEFAANVYPSYCAGWAVLYSPDVVFLLYREAQRSEYFWIDDVHVTGTLAARANLTQTPLGSLALTEKQVDALIGSSKRDNGSSIGVFLFGSPNLPLSSIQKLWQVVQSRRHAANTHTPVS